MKLRGIPTTISHGGIISVSAVWALTWIKRGSAGSPAARKLSSAAGQKLPDFNGLLGSGLANRLADRDTLRARSAAAILHAAFASAVRRRGTSMFRALDSLRLIEVPRRFYSARASYEISEESVPRFAPRGFDFCAPLVCTKSWRGRIVEKFDPV